MTATHPGVSAIAYRYAVCLPPFLPGSLAVIIAHDVAPADNDGSDATGGAASKRPPRTWVFCPDALCLDSRPSGSALPQW